MGARWRFAALMMMTMTMTMLASAARGDDLWDRRDPGMANLFNDYRARRVGDLLTIVIDETTGVDSQEKREMNKATNTSANASAKGSSSSLGQVLKSFAADFDGQYSSQRKFDGKSNSTIDRKFTDRMTVQVIAVMPNGNIVIEGGRQRLIGREVRTLRMMGIVRPADIGAYNTVQSQYIADLRVSYHGRGPDTNFTNQGWGGRILNVIWPH